MSLPRFDLDRYDPAGLLRALDDARLVENGSEIYHRLDYGGDELEIHYPDCNSVPVPVEVLSTARRACAGICDIDNLVQANCKNEAGQSDLDPRNFMLHIGYINAFPNRIQVRYWGIVVNTEWEAEFRWCERDGWSPLNFQA